MTNSVKEIKQLAEKLKNKPEEVVLQASGVVRWTNWCFCQFCLRTLSVKNKSSTAKTNKIQIALNKDARSAEAFVKVNSTELRSILSNLINNAIESYADNDGGVEIELSASDRTCTITIRDHGCGVPAEYMKELGRKQITFKGDRTIRPYIHFLLYCPKLKRSSKQKLASSLTDAFTKAIGDETQKPIIHICEHPYDNVVVDGQLLSDRYAECANRKFSMTCRRTEKSNVPAKTLFHRRDRRPRSHEAVPFCNGNFS